MKNNIEDINTVQKILRGAQTGLWTIEIEEGKLPRLYADETMLYLMGLDKMPEPEECYRLWYGGIDPDYCGTVEDTVSKIIQKGQAEVSYPWYHPVKGRMYVRCGGVCNREGDVLLLSGYHQDITDVTLVQRENERLERLNGDIISSVCDTYDAIYRVNLEDETVLFLHTMDDIKDWEGKNVEYPKFFEMLSQIWHADDIEEMKKVLSPEHVREMILSGNQSYAGEYRRRAEGGEYRIKSVKIHSDKSGSEEQYAIITVQDIEEQKRLWERSNEALREAYESAKKASQVKSEFLSRMSHDIRTPLNAIIGMTQLARMNLNDTERVLDCLDKIASSGQMLLSLVNEVLDMSRLESGRMSDKSEKIDIMEFLQSFKRMFASDTEHKKQSFKVSCEGLAHSAVEGNKGYMQRVVMNIISNAVKYTPEGGSISVRVREHESRIAQYGSYEFVVEDNGIGMTKEFLEKIYEPFNRANDPKAEGVQGTGLGMSITRSLVQMMGGSIVLESSPGKGTKVTVFLDLKIWGGDESDKERDKENGRSDDEAREEKGAAAAEDIYGEKPLAGRKCLLVEDHPINQEITVEFLSMAGASVDVAENGKRAVERFSEAPENYYDVIFMDIQMPVMNGYEAARAIRSLDRKDAAEIPIIAMSANAFSEDIIASHRAGMNEHIAKPIDIKHLINTVVRFLKP